MYFIAFQELMFNWFPYMYMGSCTMSFVTTSTYLLQPLQPISWVIWINAAKISLGTFPVPDLM